MKFCNGCGKPLAAPEKDTGGEKIFAEYASLSKRIKEGDEIAFSEMYEKSEKLVYATCYGILRNHDDANDAMQDTYMTVYRTISSLQDDMKFLGWLKRIAATRSLNLYKKLKGDVSYDDAIGSEEEITGDDDLEMLPDTYIMQKTKRDILEAIMKANLSDVQYQTIVMHYYDEFPVELIAKLMDCPVGTVKTRLKSARVKIKEGVTEYEEKNKDRIFAGAIILPFLTRFFEEQAKHMDLPKINPLGLIGKGAGTGASEAAGSGAAATGAASAGATAAAAAGTAAKIGFMSTLAGKITVVAVAAALIGGIGITTLILKNSDDDSSRRHTRRERNRDDDEDETETESLVDETEAPTETPTPTSTPTPTPSPTPTPEPVLMSETVYNADGSFKSVTEYVYDNDGRILEENTKALTLPDYMEEYSNQLTWFDDGMYLDCQTINTYDEEGKLICSETSSANDVVDDLPPGEINYIYDENGTLTGYTQGQSGFPDGTRIIYDEEGRKVREELCSVNFEDFIENGVYTLEDDTYGYDLYYYDEKGNLIRIVYDADYPDLSTESTFEYDDNGVLIREAVREYRDAPIEINTYEYDENGLLLKKNTYDENGTLLSYTEYNYG